MLPVAGLRSAVDKLGLGVESVRNSYLHSPRIWKTQRSERRTNLGSVEAGCEPQQKAKMDGRLTSTKHYFYIPDSIFLSPELLIG